LLGIQKKAAQTENQMNMFTSASFLVFSTKPTSSMAKSVFEILDEEFI